MNQPSLLIAPRDHVWAIRHVVCIYKGELRKVYFYDISPNLNDSKMTGVFRFRYLGHFVVSLLFCSLLLVFYDKE